ncbi:isoleucine--tRNA ligase, cytoplasmic [Micropterus dolomieu]|uniref:isoleucine--tRNA ligase, cytoplasmic n=1 Tax=Micropterus dolomieu TaxID=147949 RepID=UPI001E8E8ADB|nr:isoleucine--tRNA ligase, cytoplasmic [Micropterus dolomieu]XP_045932220.1 isoleucine--tRNA ligase, cytoplasmic [Micropterus dolomieu]XP_045932221.1 isoleucine--tRNA ligase, cytoplasmic [Micropterus dolomieu]XP_045932222.1 isoleucine--tRNA ligase, cytoplasmic [Micropterus dolomieu]
MVEPVPESLNFPSEEEKILQLWQEKDCFQECLKQSKNKPKYTFYDGPPFATGLPHYGHILAGTIKDIVTRFAHQSGFHVDRRFGWDCHGLPVEYEIDKTLGIKGPEDVAKMGIAEYNKQCRNIVMRYANEWEVSVKRMGRWIDFKNDYKTLYPWFMETVWWVFKQLYDKGLVYRGVKVMPFSTACNTPLSNFEANQNYKDVQDPSVIVNFPLVENEDVALIAWTTTPWTLPSNLALCVNPEFLYVKVKDNTTGKTYIMMEARLGALFKSESEYTLLEKFPGKTLKGKKYKPLFQYFAKCGEKGAFQVVMDNYVKEEEGTGVVHQAPYFGADDYRVCTEFNIIQRDQAPICPVDASGCFTSEVTDFAGQYVKDADKHIIKWLKEKGRLVNASTFKHNYPFCWRSDTPLIYKAVPSWFVRVEHMVEKLLDNNDKCYWVPEFVREKRFGNWLRDARDWAISRNRYWGTPIPLWVSDDFEEVVCVGSMAELEELTGVKVTDLHRESIDSLTIPSRCGKGVLRRVTEVFDCWFESGSMPYAQVHYPFENRKEFEDTFPADFIAEGIDQTRGWFYTLLVLSTALFGKPPFKNVIVNGLVLASDGQKMSKRKKNYPDPGLIVQNYGADALRLYLINSPVVRADNLRFKEEGVRDVLKDVFLPWYNAYRFLVQNVQRLQKEDEIGFMYNENTSKQSDNIMDKWIQSFTQSLIQFFKAEMDAYRLYTVVPRLVKFVDMLTNWYVRTNRRRLKGESGTEDCLWALETLFSVLFSMCRLMAPFTPFITEMMYQNLRHLIDPASVEEKDSGSIHYLMLPQVRESVIDKRIESAVSQMQSVIELGRVIRDRKTLPVKYPLKEVVVIHQDPEALRDIQSLQKYILEELNVRQLTLSTDKDKYGISLRAEPDHMVLGKRLKGAFKAVAASIKELTSEQLESFQKTGSIMVDSHELHEEDLRLMYTFNQSSGSAAQYEAHSDAQVLVLLDVSPDQSMLDEGVAREVINRIQKLRKKGHLVPSDEITVYYRCQPEGEYLDSVIQAHTEFILATTKAPLLPFPVPKTASVIIEEKTQLKGSDLELTIVKGSSAPRAALNGPACTYVNIRVKVNNKEQEGVVLLENPKGDNRLNLDKLKNVCSSIFGTNNTRLRFFNNGTELTSKIDLQALSGKTLSVTSGSSSPGPAPAPTPDTLLCPYVNLLLCNAQPAECQTGEVGTLLLVNPVGQNGLDYSGLLSETAKVFGLRSRRLKLYLDQDLTQELPADSSVTSLDNKTLFVRVIPTTAEA